MPEEVKELSQEEIAEAIEKKWCPFCKSEESIKRDVESGTESGNAQRRFYLKETAFQDCFLMQYGETDYGDITTEGPTEAVFCSDCEKEIPEEIWEKWLI